jgi:hypothetical protein
LSRPKPTRVAVLIEEEEEVIMLRALIKIIRQYLQ